MRNRRNIGFVGTVAAATVGNFAAHGIRSAFGRRNPGRFPTHCPECEAPGYRWIRCPTCSTDTWSCAFCGYGEDCVCAEFHSGQVTSDYVPPLPPVPGEPVTDYRAYLQWPQGSRRTRGNPGQPAPPKHAQHLLREFHSRDARETVDLSRARWPERMRPVAHAVAIYYDSDKKDPGDPNDRQGKPKAFIHTFDAYEKDGPPVFVYEAGDGEGAITTRWPEWIVYLGTTTGWIEEREAGRQRERRVPGGTLAATEDGKRLVVIDGRDRIHLFDGGGLVVTWRGIEG